MILSSDMIQEFAKVTNDDKQTQTESTFYGTIAKYDDKLYVRIDGSDQLTPITATADIKPNDRVVVMIKNHSATVTGNITSPSASSDSVKDLDGKVDEMGTQISEFEIVVADKIGTKEFSAQVGRIDTLVSNNVTIREELNTNKASINELETNKASVKDLEATNAEIEKLDASKITADFVETHYAKIEDLEATNLKVVTLTGTYGDFVVLTTTKFEALDASIKKLDTEKLTAEQANIKYANIDFSNIQMAAVKELFTKSGIIKDLVVGDQSITGELVGVTIKGDLIEGSTIIADKLVIKGEDGIYYKLNTLGGVTPDGEITEEKLQNGLHGDVLIKKSITAEKINVHDLVAFGATIGGFHITDDTIYSGVKESPTNTTRGIYLDNLGQIGLGDSNKYLRYYKDSDGKWKFELAADSIKLGATSKNLEEEMETIKDVKESANEAALAVASIGAQQEINGSSILSISNQLANLIVGNDGAVFKEVLEDGTVRYNFSNMQGNIDAAKADIVKLQNSEASAEEKIEAVKRILNQHSQTLSYIAEGTIQEGVDKGCPFIELGVNKDANGNNINSKFKVRITNKSIQFMENDNSVAWIDNEELHIRKSEIVNEQKVGGFSWVIRDNGNMGLIWKGVNS